MKLDKSGSDKFLSDFLLFIDPIVKLKNECSKKELKSMCQKYGPCLLQIVKDSLSVLKTNDLPTSCSKNIIKACNESVISLYKIKSLLSCKSLALETLICQLITRCIDNNQTGGAMDAAVSFTMYIQQYLQPSCITPRIIKCNGVSYTIIIPKLSSWNDSIDATSDDLKNLIIVYLYNICQCLFHDDCIESINLLTDISFSQLSIWIQSLSDKNQRNEKILSVCSLLSSCAIKIENKGNYEDALECREKHFKYLSLHGSFEDYHDQASKFATHYLIVNLSKKCMEKIQSVTSALLLDLSKKIVSLVDKKCSPSIFLPACSNYCFLAHAYCDFSIKSQIKGESALLLSSQCLLFLNKLCKKHDSEENVANELKVYQSILEMKVSHLIITLKVTSNPGSDHMSESLNFLKRSLAHAPNSSMLNTLKKEKSIIYIDNLMRQFNCLNSLKSIVTFLECFIKRSDATILPDEWWIVIERYYVNYSDIVSSCIDMETKESQKGKRIFSVSKYFISLRGAVASRLLRIKGCDDATRLDHHLNSISSYCNNIIESLNAHVPCTKESLPAGLIQEVQMVTSLLHNDGVVYYNAKNFYIAQVLFSLSVQMWEILIKLSSELLKSSKFDWRYGLVATCFYQSGCFSKYLKNLAFSLAWSYKSSNQFSSCSSHESIIKLVDASLKCHNSNNTNDKDFNLTEALSRSCKNVGLDYCRINILFNHVYNSFCSQFLKSIKFSKAGNAKFYFNIANQLISYMIDELLVEEKLIILKAYAMVQRGDLIYKMQCGSSLLEMTVVPAPSAISIIEKSLNILESSNLSHHCLSYENLDDHKAMALSVLGLILHQEGSLESVSAFDRSLASWTSMLENNLKCFDISLSCSMLFNLSSLFSLRDDKIRQLKCLELVVSLCSASEKSITSSESYIFLSFALSFIGEVYHEMGHANIATEHYQKSQEMLIKYGIDLNDPKNGDNSMVVQDAVITWLINKTLLLVDTEDSPFFDSQATIRTASCWQDCSDKSGGPLYANTLSILKEKEGRAVNALSESVNALKLYKQVVSSKYTTVHDSLLAKRFSRALKQCGRMWELSGNQKKAEYVYKKGLNLGLTLKSLALERTFYQCLGSLYASCHRWDECDENLLLAEKCFQLKSEHDGFSCQTDHVFDLLANGDSSLMRKRLEEALKFYTQAEKYIAQISESSLISNFDSIISHSNENQNSMNLVTGKKKEKIKKDSKPTKKNKSNPLSKPSDKKNGVMNLLLDNLLGKVLLRKAKVFLEEKQISISLSCLNEALSLSSEPFDKGVIKFYQGKCLMAMAREKGSIDASWHVDNLYHIVDENITAAFDKMIESYTIIKTYGNPHLTKEIMRSLVISRGFGLLKNVTIPTIYLLHASFGTTIQIQMLRRLSNHIEVSNDNFVESFNKLEIEPNIANSRKLFEINYSLEEDIKFFEKSIESIPREWSISTLCSNTDGSFTVSRISDGESVVIRLSSSDDSCKDIISKFKDIMEQSSLTLKDTGVKISVGEISVSDKLSSSEKKSWWNDRKSLDKRLEKMMIEVQDKLLGPWVVLLRGSLIDPNLAGLTDKLANKNFKDLIELVNLKLSDDQKSHRLFLFRLLINGADAITVKQFRQGVNVILGGDKFSVAPRDMDESEAKTLANSTYTESLFLINNQASRIESKRIKESKPEHSIVFPNEVAPDRMTVPLLKEQLNKKGLSTIGVKADLVSRLMKSNEESKNVLVSDNIDASSRHPVILILGEGLQKIPWESIPALINDPVSRMPCLSLILHNLNSTKMNNINPKSASYCINPSGDLKETENRFKPIIESLGWKGGIPLGAKPSTNEFKNAILNHDLFLYCGHGSGDQFLQRDEIEALPRAALTLLMGCSSGALKEEGIFEPYGTPLSYLLAGSPAVIANLWDVTDADIDRFCETLLNCWIGESKAHAKKLIPLLDFIPNSRKSCKLRFLVGAAPVVYGLPSFLKLNSKS